MWRERIVSVAETELRFVAEKSADMAECFGTQTLPITFMRVIDEMPRHIRVEIIHTRAATTRQEPAPALVLKTAEAIRLARL